MPVKTKSDIAALKDLSENDRSDLSALFDSIEDRNGQITDLRKKSTDADDVVKKNRDLEKLLADKENLSKELQDKLAVLTTHAPAPTETFDDLLPFAELRKDLENLFSDDEASE